MPAGYITASGESPLECVKVIVEVGSIYELTVGSGPDPVMTMNDNVTDICVKDPTKNLFDIKIHACSPQVCILMIRQVSRQSTQCDKVPNIYPIFYSNVETIRTII